MGRFGQIWADRANKIGSATTVARAEIAVDPVSRFLTVDAPHFPWLCFYQALDQPGDGPRWLLMRPARAIMAPSETSPDGPDGSY